MARRNTQVRSAQRAARRESACAAIAPRPLHDLQCWTQAAILARSNDPRTPQEIRPNSRLDSHQRLAIYTRSVYGRFRDALATDFRAVQGCLGEDDWRELCDAYIRECASQHQNLNFYGHAFADCIAGFFGATTSKKRPPALFLSELARLEWAVTSIFDRADQAPLTPDAIARISAKRWGRIRLGVRPTVEAHAFHYPVNRYLQAVLDGATPAIPKKKASWCQVYRIEHRVWRLDLEAGRYELLRALMDGKPLGHALEIAAEKIGGDEESAAATVQGWFADWVQDGIFYSVQ